MFEYFKRKELGELIIIVLTSEYNAEFGLKSHVFLGCPTKTSVDGLKARICGATQIPIDRIMLLFCGEVLSNGKGLVPEDAFELPDSVDEDTSSYRARLCLHITDAKILENKEEDNDDNRNHIANAEIAEERVLKAKHKRKKEKGDFNLEKELQELQSSLYFSMLSNAGYDNEGAFANMTLETLRGPGLWVPLGPAQRILARCGQLKQQQDNKDKASSRPQYRQIEVGANDSTNNAHTNERRESNSEHGSVQQHSTIHKADARREYDQQIIREKKAARETAALLRNAKMIKKSDGRKQHSEELQKKIDLLKMRCAQETAESSSDFDEITNILYGSYSNLRAMNQLAEGGRSDQHHPQKEARALTSGIKASALPVGNNSSVVTTGPGSPSKQLRAMRTSASQPSLTGPTIPGGAVTFRAPGRAEDHITSLSSCFCCAKHAQVAMQNRQEYVAQRRIYHTMELRVQLARLPSAQSGFVTSSTLQAVAAHHLKAYHGMPQRSADPDLVSQCVHASRLDLPEQRKTVLWVQREEASEENLVSVLPVAWYSPQRFIDAFVDLMESLDIERLVQYEEAAQAEVLYQDVPPPHIV